MKLTVLAVAAALCVNGHPAQRSPHVTYGGASLVHGMVRDHIIPLCLGGPDVKDNIQYQEPVESYAADRIEWHACEAYCSRIWSIDDAIDYVISWKSEHS